MILNSEVAYVGHLQISEENFDLLFFVVAFIRYLWWYEERVELIAPGSRVHWEFISSRYQL
jgi:hypothetical protein